LVESGLKDDKKRHWKEIIFPYLISED